MGLLPNDETVYTLLFADDQLIIGEEYRNWGVNINYMAIRADPEDLILEDVIRPIKHCTEYTYLGIKT